MMDIRKFFRLMIVIMLMPAVDTVAQAFPISFWWGPPSTHNTLESWQTVADAGFTFVGPNRLYDEEDNLKMLDLCQQVGIKAMVSDQDIKPWMTRVEGWQDSLTRKVARYANHPALYGYFISDEPHAGYFGPLRQIQDHMRSLGVGQPVYSVLYPNYAKPHQTLTETYDEYVAAYLRDVNPDVLSWDHYPFLKRTGTYFSNLETMRQQASHAGKDLWHVVQGPGWSGKPDLTREELRWQIHTSLAYGVKGLMYFFYWPIPGDRWEGHGIVDADGQPRPIYHLIKEMNAELRLLGEHFLRLQPVAVYHSGDLPSGTTAIPPGFMVRVADNAPAIISYLKAEGSEDRFLFVVNRDDRQSRNILLDLVDSIHSVTMLHKASNLFAPVQPVGQRISLDLEAGEGALLKIQNVKQDLNFTFDDHAEGFASGAGQGIPRVDGGKLIFPVDRGSFLHHESLKIRAGSVRRVTVRMRSPNSTRAILFWRTPEQAFYGHNQSVVFDVEGSNEFREYDLDFSVHPVWRGSGIIGLRLVPDYDNRNVGQSIEIDELRSY